ncbi:MAG: glycoside hydrolase family 95 protein [Opitutales bacterium]|nr:glycoside hydrolase family 95 protein [Opitutales bacterium]
MKVYPSISISLILSALVSPVFASIPSSGYIWFDTPAQTFDDNWFVTPDNRGARKGWEWEGLPVGNGRVGAMAMEAPGRQRLQLNEISLWTGGENLGGNCSGYSYGPTTGRNGFGNYQPFANLIADFGTAQATDFTRSLQLEGGIAKAEYKSNGTAYTREVFAAQERNAIVAVYTCSKKGGLTGTFALTPEHNAKIAANKNGTITMTGTLENGMKFAAKVRLYVTGGKISTLGGNGDIHVKYEGGGDAMHSVYDGKKLAKLKVENADKIIAVIAMHTDYVLDEKKGFKGGDPVPATEATLKAVEALLADKNLANVCTQKNRELYNRVKIELGKTDADTAKLPTPERLKKYKNTQKDPDLEETLFQFGRYCLLSSSRGSLPANLQGIWNAKVYAPWASDYHNNINIQEAYWPAEVCNLSECHLPLLNYITETAPAAREMTKREFGAGTRGWTQRISQNPWGAGGWSMWNVPINAWYALHMWEHFQFTQDKNFLKNQAYPMMKEACNFWEDHLKELGKDGKGFESKGNADMSQLKGMPAGTLVAPKGWSHEWGPVEDGVAHDQQLVRDLFNNTIAAAKVLKVDAAWAKKLAEKRDRLAPSKIAKGGYLQEWMIDRPDMVSGHRHTSHLFAVYPGSEISFEKTPELAAAAKKSLELRGTAGDSRRSWSWPWRAALWARFKEGDKAHEMIEGLLIHNTLPNLLTTHEPFQMDGNFSLPAAVAEMFVQSQTGDIVLLPAPCKAWPKGKISGLKARGNITVAMEWENGKVKNYKLSSPIPQEVTVIVNGKSKKEKVQPAKK